MKKVGRFKKNKFREFGDGIMDKIDPCKTKVVYRKHICRYAGYAC
jgi:hypothetical protein